MADLLPDELVVPTRDKLRDKYLRSYRLRNSSADTGPNSQPYVDASSFADQMMLAYADCVRISNGTNDDTSSGAWLESHAKALGITRPPAAGASGFVSIVASTGGGTIFDGDEIKDPVSGLRFKCTATALYTNAAQVPITGIDTGPATNLKAGTVMQWTSPRPGIGQNATVVTQTDGSGLSGGRDAASDEDLRLLMQEKRANPPASGNASEYQETIETIPGLAVQKAFLYPCILGPGTTAFVFTMQPGTAGGSRIPNGTQIAQVAAVLQDKFPGDDSIFAATLSPQNIAFGYKVTWNSSAPGWFDATPWPPYVPGDVVRISNGAPTTALSFRLSTGTTTTTPQVGQTIGFYDSTTGTFKKKRIASVTVVVANKTWDLTVDTSNNSSDANYVPNGYLAGQIASPWSNSLDAVAGAVTPYVASNIGPGEMVASFSDPGIRQRRLPQSPDSWPNTISNRALRPVQDLSVVFDADLVMPTVPFATTVGTPGVSANLIGVLDVAVYNQ